MTSRVLLLIDKYDRKPYVAGVCARNIANAFRRIGIETHVLAFKTKNVCSQEELPFVHYFTPTLVERLFMKSDDYSDTFQGRLLFKTAKILSKTRKLFFLYRYPDDTLFLPYKILNEIEKLDTLYKFDIIISIQARLVFSKGGFLWKKKHPNRKWVMYCVDSYADGYPKKFINDSFRINGGKKIDRKFLKLVDRFYIVECHRKFYEQPFYDEFREKIEYVDIPLFIPNNKNIMNYFSPEKWIYAGSFMEFGYNPWKICEYFMALPSKEGRVLHFFSRGDCEEKISVLAQNSNGKIVRHGFVPAEQLKQEMETAGVFVSVGIRNSAQISGKIFDYFGYMKKIVHFSSGERDPNLPYMKKYPYSFVVGPESTLEDTIPKLTEFLESPLVIDKKTIEYIHNTYRKSHPEYFAERIADFLFLQHSE